MVQGRDRGCAHAVVAALTVLFIVSPGWCDVTNGRIVNESYQTLCAEVDNVNVPMFFPGVKAFRITATHPAYYPASINMRGADFSDCSFADRGIWTIGHDDRNWREFLQHGFGGTNHFYAQDRPPAGVDNHHSLFPKEINHDWMNDQYIHFTADEDEDANVELLIGSTLTLKLAAVGGGLAEKRLDIKCLTWNGTGWTDHGNRQFTPEELSAQWDIPDLTWLPGTDTNVIHFKLMKKDDGGQTAETSWGVYDHVQLHKRPEGGETTLAALYSNRYEVAIMPVHIDFWWRYPESMTVAVVDGPVATNIHYFRILKTRPDIEPPESDEIFVMYEDGNARIIPLPPEGIDWTPYGGSIIIGSSIPSKRPVAPINHVLIDPKDLSMDITYDDGSSAHMELWADPSRTVVDVSDITYDTSERPFARFRSMWVVDGKSDIDRVSHQGGTDAIMGSWKEREGTWWQFSRDIPSYHNTYSPDFRVEVMDPMPAIVTMEAESRKVKSDAKKKKRKSASGGKVRKFDEHGGFADFAIDVPADIADAYLHVRYAAARPGSMITVLLDGEEGDATHTVNTGGWDVFEGLPALYLGDLEKGKHAIRLEIGPGAEGVELDRIDVVAQSGAVPHDERIVLMQGESAEEGRGYLVKDRKTAVGGKSIHMTNTGASVSFMFDTTNDVADAFMRLRYADDVGPTKVEVTLDERLVARFPTDSTGSWDTFTNLPPLYLGAIRAGSHKIRFRTSPETWGVDIDEFEIFERQK